MENYDKWKLDNNESEVDYYECEEEITFICDNSEMYEEFKEKMEKLAKQYGVETC